MSFATFQDDQHQLLLDTLEITDSTFGFCLTWSDVFAHGTGGAIFAFNSTLTIARCFFHDNTAFEGGALLAFDADLSISHSQIARNLARDNAGGSWSMSYFDAESIIPHCVMQSSNWTSNHAMKACGAFSANDTSPIISFCIFDSNSAGEAAGAIGINGISHNYVSRGQFYTNSCQTKPHSPCPALWAHDELTREGSVIHFESLIFSKNFVGQELLGSIATWGRVTVLLIGPFCFDALSQS
jgi:hypothetical protein